MVSDGDFFYVFSFIILGYSGGPILGLCFLTTVGVKFDIEEMIFLSIFFFIRVLCITQVLPVVFLSNDFTLNKLFILSNLYSHSP